jgi:hypothetical protein
MPDPTNNQDTGGQPQAETVGVSRAELEQLRASKSKLDKYTELAKSADFESADEYIEALEDAAYQNLNIGQPVKQPQPTPAAQPAAQSAAQPAVQPAAQPQPGLSESETQTRRMAAQASMAAHEANYNIIQNTLPTEQKSPFKTDELFKFITKNQLLVGHIAYSKFNGNPYLAAEHVLRMEKGMTPPGQTPAENKDALANAAAGTTLPSGGRSIVPGNLTPEQRRAEYNKRSADAIAPDTPYKMPT